MRLEYKWQVAFIAAIGLFMVVLDNSIVSVALPQMQQTFHTSIATITWVVTGYFLSQAAIIPVTGYLSDKVGMWRMFLLTLSGFLLGSVLCALAPTAPLLIIFRVVQGIGGGGLFPVAYAIVFRTFPPDERGPASAAIGAPVLLAPAFGPTIGGYLTTTFNWNAIFIINIPIGIAALAFALLLLRRYPAAQRAREEASATARRLDVPGLTLATVGFTVFVFGISAASSRGWGDGLVEATLSGGAILLCLFVIVELRTKDPVIDIRLFLNYTFSIANVLTWVVAALLFGGMVLLPFFFENVQGLPPLVAGSFLIAQGVASAVGTVISGILYNRVGPRIIIALGFACMVVGTVGLTRLDTTTSGLSLQPWLVIRGLGLGLSNIPLQTLALSVVSNKAMARASSLLNVTRQVAGAVGISVFTTYLSLQANVYVQPAVSPSRHVFSGITTACQPLLNHAGQTTGAFQACVLTHTTAAGLSDTFMLMTICSGFCILLALFVGRDLTIKSVESKQKESVAVQ
jgi:EmrB/QacA subfamily drug resistance transporter